MLKRQDDSCHASIISLFCDPFAAVAAMRQLTAIGVAENEIDLVGFLGTREQDWNPLLVAMGLPVTHAAYYREEFEDGAIMLIIRAADPAPKKSFVRVLKQHGGFVSEGDHTMEASNHESQ
jgi:hypothetical protein